MNNKKEQVAQLSLHKQVKVPVNYAFIDESISDIVSVLNENGFVTTSSCCGLGNELDSNDFYISFDTSKFDVNWLFWLVDYLAFAKKTELTMTLPDPFTIMKNTGEKAETIRFNFNYRLLNDSKKIECLNHLKKYIFLYFDLLEGLKK